MRDVIMVISDYISMKRLETAQVAESCGWKESRLISILSGSKKLSAGDYGILCDALGVPYDFFYQQSMGVYAAC